MTKEHLQLSLFYVEIQSNISAPPQEVTLSWAQGLHPFGIHLKHITLYYFLAHKYL